MQTHPNVLLPPDYLMYESFQLNYYKYFSGGAESAKWITDLVKPYRSLYSINILDWGCGPGRIIRHLEKYVDSSNRLFGTDYNKHSISWCRENLTGIEFNHNSTKAALPYECNFFGFIYGVSIFTHLSRQGHIDWFTELYRVLEKGGILILTTQGSNFRGKLTKAERTVFDAGELVVRGKVREGHRVYSSFQPKEFMVELCTPATILKHIESPPLPGRAIPQDVWILQK